MAHIEEYDEALWYFRAAQKLSRTTSELYGIAAYDRAVLLFHSGAFIEAQAAFTHILSPRCTVVS